MRAGSSARALILTVGGVSVPLLAPAQEAQESPKPNVAGDRGRSIGVTVLQNWDRSGVRFYTGVRRYSVDRPDVPLEPITVVPFGALIAF